ncbi:phasin family protein [Duganella callida]|nr:phasin family protein [Duganella callida]
MSSITETFSAATKSQLEAQFQIFANLSKAAVDSAEKVIALNLNTTRASVEKSSAAAKKLLAAKDPKEFFSLSAAEPIALDKLFAYSRELVNIATAAQSQLLQTAQSGIRKAGAATVAAAKPAVLPPVTAPAAAPTSPAVTAAVLAAVHAVNEPVPPAEITTPKPVAAQLDIEDVEPIEVKADVPHVFPEPAVKPIALSPSEAKPTKTKSASAPKARK